MLPWRKREREGETSFSAPPSLNLSFESVFPRAKFDLTKAIKKKEKVQEKQERATSLSLSLLLSPSLSSLFVKKVSLRCRRKSLSRQFLLLLPMIIDVVRISVLPPEALESDGQAAETEKEEKAKDLLFCSLGRKKAEVRSTATLVMARSKKKKKKKSLTRLSLDANLRQTTRYEDLHCLSLSLASVRLSRLSFLLLLLVAFLSAFFSFAQPKLLGAEDAWVRLASLERWQRSSREEKQKKVEVLFLPSPPHKRIGTIKL